MVDVLYDANVNGIIQQEVSKSVKLRDIFLFCLRRLAIYDLQIFWLYIYVIKTTPC